MMGIMSLFYADENYVKGKLSKLKCDFNVMLSEDIGKV